MADKSWQLTGNTNNAADDFLGTADSQPLVFKTAGSECARIDISGNVGIGTSTPTYPVHLATGKGLRIEGGTAADDTANYLSFGGYGMFGIDAAGVPNGRFVIDNLGNVGIGTPAPATILHVAGDVTVTGDILLTGADCAEQFDAEEDDSPGPGTVVVLDEEGAVRQSLDAYDRKVAGVVSGAGTYRPGIVLDRQSAGAHRVAVALLGKVYCKVDAQYSPIMIGDLLTTSPTPGHAMKAQEPARAFGAVLGKALRKHARGKGLIPVLITLQ